MAAARSPDAEDVPQACHQAVLAGLSGVVKTAWGEVHRIASGRYVQRQAILALKHPWRADGQWIGRVWQRWGFPFAFGITHIPPTESDAEEVADEVLDEGEGV